jgi:hypothetical protein
LEVEAVQVVQRMRELHSTAQQDLVTDKDAAPEEVIDLLEDLVGEAGTQMAAAAQINAFQRRFG